MSFTGIASSVESHVLSGTNHKYYQLKNFTNSGVKEKDKTLLEGNYFVISPDDYLWHFISEALTQYELLLKEIPDLKILFMAVGNQSFGKEEMTIRDFLQMIHKKDTYKNLAYIEDVFKIYLGENYLEEKIYDYYFSKIIIENAYLLYDLRGIISRGIFFMDGKNEKPYWLKGRHRKLKNTGEVWFESDHNPWSNLDNSMADWQKEGMRLIRKRVLPFLSKKELPKKIYIDRTDANNKYREYVAKDPGLAHRYFNKEYLIKNYFVENGYTSISMTDYGYIDQLNIYYNATHIAGLCGTGMLGGFVGNRGTKVIQIYVNHEYHFSYSYLTEIAPIDILSIDLKGSYDGRSLLSSFKLILDRYRKAGLLDG